VLVAADTVAEAGARMRSVLKRFSLQTEVTTKEV
jgi:hypothetical protein